MREDPKKVREDPKKVREDPKKVRKDPKDPSMMREDPKKVREERAKLQRDADALKEGRTKMSDAPARVRITGSCGSSVDVEAADGRNRRGSADGGNGGSAEVSCINTCTTLVFFVNGKKVVDEHVDPEFTLVRYLRDKLRLTGTKLACGEGGCGACTVMLSCYRHAQRTFSHVCVNACLTPVASVHGMAVTTVEGVGSLRTRLHVIQENLAKAHGSQCGFCTPGIVMAVYTLLRNNPVPHLDDIHHYLTGNLCRCTGYRPILAGLAALTADALLPPPCTTTNCCKLNSSATGREGTTRDQHCPRAGEAATNGGDVEQGDYAVGEGVKATDRVVETNRGFTSAPVVHNGLETNNGVVDNCINSVNDHHDNDNKSSLETNCPVQKGSFKISGQDDKSRLKSNDGIDKECLKTNVDVDSGSFKRKGEEKTTDCTDNTGQWDCTPSPCYHPTQEIIFPPELKVSDHLEKQALMFRGPRVTYWRPTTLAHLLTLRHHHPHAKIIVGNTEVGVEMNVKKQLYPILVNPSKVAEMTSVVLEKSRVTFGAAVTLTTVQDTLRHQVNTQPEHRTRTFSAILEILNWFAGKQIRNVASLGGNIMTSSPISDLNPVLVAGGSSLTFTSLRGERRVLMNEKFFTGYRRNAAHPTEVLLAVHVPFTQQEEYIQSYKQSRRRDDDIAIVNAAMKVTMMPHSTTVQHLSVVFGGMAATTVLATTTMKELVGCAWDAPLLQKAIKLLLEDLPLDPSAPGGMVEYRRVLTLSFFFKFYLSVRGWLSEYVPAQVDPLPEDQLAATTPYQRPATTATQTFQQVPESQEEHDLIGRPVVHTSAYKQTTGEAVYVDDIPHLENELHAALVVSSRAHAKILAIDEAQALELEDVEAFFCARDLLGEMNMMGMLDMDEQVFARNKVECVGQVVGVVVARDHAKAQQAAALVRVHYQDLSPPIITIEDAIKEKSWWGPWTIRRGCVEYGFNIATHTLEGEMRIGGQEHFYMETNVHIAIPKGEDGEMEMFSATQNPSGTQQQVAKALGVPASRVVVRVKRLGGGFGGKETRSVVASVPAAVAAARLNRPVRIRLERQEDMLVTGGRHPFLCRWKAGFTPDGRLTAIQAYVYVNSGHTLDLSSCLLQKTLFSFDSAYNIQNVSVTGYACRTNLPSNTAFRGFGAPQANMFMEDILSQVSAFLKLDPSQVQERNMYQAGDKTIVGCKLDHFPITRCWQQVMDTADVHARKASVHKFNRENTYRKRGLAVAPAHFGIAYERCLNQAGALIHIYTDGSVLVSHGGIEMGQGLHTKMIQVVSRALGVSAENIHLTETATDKVPNTSPTAASVSTDINGMAVLKACRELASRLQPYMSKDPTGTWRDWVLAAYQDQVSLSATGFYRTPGISDFDFETQTGHPFNYYAGGAAVTEVEVDCLTGHHTILRTDIVMDVGNSLNPALDIGQVEGAFVQGAGLFTLEELLYSPEGILLTRGPGAYKIPGFQDIPCEFHVSLLKDSPNPRAVFSSKGVGEPPLLLASSVFQSIKAAVGAARQDHNLDPVFRLDSPATAERIRLACQDPLILKCHRTT